MIAYGLILITTIVILNYLLHQIMENIGQREIIVMSVSGKYVMTTTYIMRDIKMTYQCKQVDIGDKCNDPRNLANDPRFKHLQKGKD